MTKKFGLFVFGSLAVLEGLFCGVTRKNSLSFIPFCRHQKGFDESAKSQLDWHSRNDFVLSRKKQVVLLYTRVSNLQKILQYTKGRCPKSCGYMCRTMFISKIF